MECFIIKHVKFCWDKPAFQYLCKQISHVDRHPQIRKKLQNTRKEVPEFMKRLTALCIALILFITPVFTMPVFAEPEPRSAFDYTDDILEDGSLIYYFEDLSLRMPAGWRGKLMVVQHESGVSFYQKASYEKYKEEDILTGGFLFQLSASVNQSFTSLPSFRYLGFSEKSAMNYYLRLPTDYPAYNEPEIRAEYDKMYSQIDYVVDNAEFYDADTQTAPVGADTISDGGASADGSAYGTTGEDGSSGSTEWTPAQVRYYFEHKMLPRYFYEKPEALLEVIRNVGVYPLWETVAKENGTDPHYPEEDYITHFYRAEDGSQIIQIEMPDPDMEPLCYRIYFIYNPDKEITAYYTAECSSFVPEICFICTWDKEDNHELCGSRDVLDRKDSGYTGALLEEAKQVALLEYITGDLTPEEASAQDAEQSGQQTSGSAGGVETAGASGQGEDVFVQNNTGEADDSGLAVIESKEMGCSFKADPSFKWDFKEGTGITVYTEHEGSIPYVIVYQGEDLIAESYEYIKEQFTPYMQQKYDSDLVEYTEYEEYEIGGRKLPAGLYTYRLQGYQVDMLRIYDSTGKRTVSYTAKYIQGHGEETLKALDNAVRTFKAE